MKFYNREEELKVLHEVQEQSFNNHSRFTVITGRRRIGKTKLILKSCEEQPIVYLFVARKNEGELCEKFSQVSVHHSKCISRTVQAHSSTYLPH